MPFMDRWYNAIVGAYDWYTRNNDHISTQQQLAKRNFADFAPLPSLRKIMQNISVTLVNTHPAFDPPRPSMPSIFLILFSILH